MYSLEEFDKQKTKVLKYIIYRKRSESEVRKKFKQTIEEDLLEDIIEYLKEAKYIDDSEYIDRLVNECKNLKNMSIKELQYKLYSKGIKKDLIEQYIYNNEEELNEYEQKSAQNIINKKKSTLNEEEILIYLMRKGYKKENISFKNKMEE